MTFTFTFTGCLGASVTDITLACLLLMLAKYTPLELPDIFAV